MSPILSDKVNRSDMTTDSSWAIRVERDRRSADIRLDPELSRITEAVLERSIAAGAHSLALTGSTALEARTHISDLDFYVVGPKVSVPDSEEEIDLYAVGPDEFGWRVHAGDDYAHWTIRFGLVLFDRGPLQWAQREMQTEYQWPDPLPKARQAQKALRFAREVSGTGDTDAAIENARLALSLAARWALIAKGDDFPMARSQLPLQLVNTPLEWLGRILSQTIFESPDLQTVDRELTSALSVVDDAVAGRVASPLGPARKHVLDARTRASLKGASFQQLSASVLGQPLSVEEALEKLGG